MTDSGKIYAEQCLESNRYVGPAPVPLEDYWDWVEAQSINQVKVEKTRLKEVFADVTTDFPKLITLATASTINADIDTAMAGNICRCGTYNDIRAAIHTAARKMQKGHSA